VQQIDAPIAASIPATRKPFPLGEALDLFSSDISLSVSLSAVLRYGVNSYFRIDSVFR
jgi:hypothetical protein